MTALTCRSWQAALGPEATEIVKKYGRDEKTPIRPT